MANKTGFNAAIEEVNSSEVPKLYANDFIAGLGPVDITLIMLHNDMPVSSLSIPFGIAKKLQVFLGEMIDEYERIAEVKIKLPSEISDKFPDSDEDGNEYEEPS